MAENVAFKLNLDAGDAPKTLADLEKRVQDVNEELSKTEIGTQQYEDLRKELVRNNKELKNLELGYEALDVEQQAAELGSVTVTPPDVVSTQYPSPLTAVKAVVLIEDCHSIPPPSKVAPEATCTVSPDLPIVIVLAFSLIILLPSTS